MLKTVGGNRPSYGSSQGLGLAHGAAWNYWWWGFLSVTEIKRSLISLLVKRGRSLIAMIVLCLKTGGKKVNSASFPLTQPPIPSLCLEPLCLRAILPGHGFCLAGLQVYWFCSHVSQHIWQGDASVCSCGRPEQQRRVWKQNNVLSSTQPAFYKYVWSNALHYFLIKSVCTTASSQRDDA